MKAHQQLLALGVLGLTIQGCTGAYQPVTHSQREAIISQSVLSSNADKYGDGSQVATGNGDTSIRPVNILGSEVGAEDTNSTVPRTTLPLTYMCSNSRSQSNGNLASAQQGLTIRFQSLDQSCEYNDTSLRAKILASKKIDMTNLSPKSTGHCSALKPGQYDLTVAMTGHDGQLMQANLELNAGIFVRTAGVTAAEMILDINPNGANFGREGDTLGATTRLLPDIPCDQTASPLVIKYDGDLQDSGPLQFTSQRDGIRFDIRGERSDPAAHAPKRISWHRSLRYLFIALPNAKGDVNGINELFGDSTRGPDGKFSTNGYQALMKYDGMSADGKTRVAPADGFIDASDDVFAKLRVWQDANFDGKAQASELHPLLDFGIARVDLNFDSRYSEADRFGNETKFKSVVQSGDGKLHLLFDIWFKYQD